MEVKNFTILLSGSRAPIALELARSFYRKGHKVIMIDSMYLTIARWSNSVSKYYFVPSPRYNNKAFVKKIQDIIYKEKVDHFIPTCEEAVFVSAVKHLFSCKVWTADHTLMLSLHSKYQFSKLGDKSLSIPKTMLLSDFNDWDHSNNYVFKPIFSRFATHTIIDKKIKSDYFKEVERTKWIVQEYIKGVEICIYSIWGEGQLKAYAAYRPIYRAGKGSGIFFEPVKNSLVFEKVKFFGNQINYTGQLSFDVIIDENDTPYFIECNPRGTSGAHLLNAGLADAFLVNKSFITQTNQEYSIKYALAIFHLNSFFTKRVRISKDVIFDWHDIKPFLFQFLSLLEIAYIKFRKNSTWLEATTGDIEWNGGEN